MATYNSGQKYNPYTQTLDDLLAFKRSRDPNYGKISDGTKVANELLGKPASGPAPAYNSGQTYNPYNRYTGTSKGTEVSRTPATAQTQPTSTYQGNSIVDYLKSAGIDSSYKNRRQLAAEYGINNYSGSSYQNLELLKKMRAQQSARTNEKPVVPDVITQAPSTPIDQPTPLDATRERETQAQISAAVDSARPTDTAAITVAGVQPTIKSIQQLLDRQNERIAADEAAIRQTQSNIETKLQELVGRGARELELRGADDPDTEEVEGFGVDQKVNQLMGLNEQMVSLNTQFEQAVANVESGTGLATAIAGKKGQLRRQQAVEIGALASMAEAVQGNIELAKAHAREIVDLEFEPVQQEIQNLSTVLQFNYDNYDRSQKNAADELQLELQERQRLIDEAKEEKDRIYNLAIEAASNGAGNSEIQSIMNSQTFGDAIRTGAQYLAPPAPSVSGKPVTQVIDGNFLQYNPLTGGWDVVFRAPEGADIVKLNGTDYLRTVDANGNYTYVKPNIPEAKTQIPAGTVRSLNDKMLQLSNLMDHPGLNSSVGPNMLARIPMLDAFGAKADFIAGVQQIISDETLQSLIQAKANGATFGALSDTELGILAAAATKLGASVVTDKNGNVTGYNMTEKAFKQELLKLQNSAATILVENNSNLTDDERQNLAETMINYRYSVANNKERGTIEVLVQSGVPNYEIAQIMGYAPPDQPTGATQMASAFNQELGTSKNFLTTMGPVTGFGSPLWKHGLDLDLKIGDPIYSPVTGTVSFVGNNGGFGKQIKVETPQGNSVWFSHLNDFNVKEGQKVSLGQPLGTGGNTGSVIPMGGGDGSHLDLTVKKADGSFMSPEEIYERLT